MNTLVETISSSENKENILNLTGSEAPEDLYKYILDFSLDQDGRIKALENYYRLEKDDTIELVSRITAMYQFSGTKNIQLFLTFICINDVQIPCFFQLECAKSLLSFTEDEEDIEKDDEPDMVEIKTENNITIRQRNDERFKNGYICLDSVCQKMLKELDFPTPYKIDTITTLMQNSEYRTQCDEYFRSVINDSRIDCDYRYKCILSLEKKKLPQEDVRLYMTNSCLDFLNNKENKIMYRILSGQYLLQHCELDNERRENVCGIIFSFSEDDTVEYNLRADAADTILTLGSDEMKIKARSIITQLGSMKGKIRTLYDNAQNVHTKEVEKSVGEILEFLLQYPTLEKDENPIDFVYVTEEIVKFHEGYSAESIDKITLSLNRIEMDRTLYSKYASNLSKIIVKLWSYIQMNEFREAMEKRLLEELEDMSGTCSSGFLSRLVNTLSGFGNLSVKISFDDQVISNFVGRLNMYARRLHEADSPFKTTHLNDIIELYIYANKINEKYPHIRSMKSLIRTYMESEGAKTEDEMIEDFSEKVINEMTLDPKRFNERQNFLIFFRVYMLRIREELYEEFKEHITDSEFDLCIRKAISIYEGVNYTA